MARLLLAMAMALWLVAAVLGSDSSGSVGAVENAGGGATVTVDNTHNTSVSQPADDFLPKGNDNDEASKAVAADPSDGNGGGLSKLAVGVIVSVSAVGLVLGVCAVVCAWRASRHEEEAMFMELGDERSYAYGRFGDYAAITGSRAFCRSGRRRMPSMVVFCMVACPREIDMRNPKDFARWRKLAEYGNHRDRLVLCEQAKILKNYRGPGNLKPIAPDAETLYPAVEYFK
ncbi:hypothetical protein PHYPSEUDO_006476 [Phytophthora pseudosyringae]|uniref:RxLR effector protein n=1 Tax=Phytophthora pseudosyringae TaxID=221518 RepID=A0A8T1VLU6_9STRA|nr:hypothetical protein PHYPSEUDO_006476 [Phytophthora pseudosyringae]